MENILEACEEIKRLAVMLERLSQMGARYELKGEAVWPRNN